MSNENVDHPLRKLTRDMPMREFIEKFILPNYGITKHKPLPKQE